MNKLKILSLAAVAAMALMAFAASSASATGLYSGGTRLGNGSVIEASMTGSSILESGSTVLDTCTESGLKGETSNAGGSTQTFVAVFVEFTWGGCTKTTDTITVGVVEFHYTSGFNWSFTLSEWSFTTITIFGSCVYGSGKSLNLGEAQGGTTGNATLNISTNIPKLSGNFACPSTALWTASYAFTSPSPLHATAS